MKKFIDSMLHSAQSFGVVDFAMFKIYMVAIGILLGAYFAPFWLEYISIVWVVAIVLAIFVVSRLFIKYRCKE